MSQLASVATVLQISSSSNFSIVKNDFSVIRLFLGWPEICKKNIYIKNLFIQILTSNFTFTEPIMNNFNQRISIVLVTKIILHFNENVNLGLYLNFPILELLIVNNMKHLFSMNWIFVFMITLLLNGITLKILMNNF